MDKREKFLERLNNVRGKKPRKNTDIERLGENFFDLLMIRFNWNSFKNNLENDYGIDYWGQIFNNDESTSEIFGVQIKSGTSFYKPTHNAFKLYDNEDNLISVNYWYNLRLPVFLFFYSKQDNKFAFVEIHDWIDNPENWEKEDGLPIVANQIFTTIDIESQIGGIKDIFYSKVKYFLNVQKLGVIIKDMDHILMSDEKSLDRFISICQNFYLRYSPSIVMFTCKILKKILEFQPNVDFIKDLIKWRFTDWIDIYRYMHPKRTEIFHLFALDCLLSIDPSIWGELFSCYNQLDFQVDSPLHDYLYITHGMYLKNENAVLSLFLNIFKNEDNSLISRLISMTFYYFYSTGSFSSYTIDSLKYMNEMEILSKLLTFSEELEEEGLSELVFQFMKTIPLKNDFLFYINKEGLFCLDDKEKYFFEKSGYKNIPNIISNQNFYSYNVDIQFSENNIHIMVQKNIFLLQSQKTEESPTKFLFPNSTVNFDQKVEVLKYSSQPYNWEKNIEAFTSDFKIDYRELLNLSNDILGKYKIDSTFRKLVYIIEIQDKKFLIPNIRNLPIYLQDD